MPTLFNKLKHVCCNCFSLLCHVLDHHGDTSFCMGAFVIAIVRTIAFAALKSSSPYYSTYTAGRIFGHESSVTDTFLFRFVMKSTKVVCYTVVKSIAMHFSWSLLILSLLILSAWPVLWSSSHPDKSV